MSFFVFAHSATESSISGKVVRGTVKVGDAVDIVGYDDEPFPSKCTKITLSNKEVPEARKDDDVEFTLDSPEFNLESGLALCAPGSIRPHAHFELDMYMLKPDEGGHTECIAKDSRPQFYVGPADTWSTVKSIKGKKCLNPGEKGIIELELVSPLALEVGFMVRLGTPDRQLQARGTVSKLLD